MAPLADFILAYNPFPPLPYHLTHYVPGETPLSTSSTVAAALVSYLAVIFGLREIMKSQSPMKFHTLSHVHNLVLSTGSGILLALIVEEIAPIMWKHGIFYAICDGRSWTRSLEFYYMINYYIKYVEMLDTVLLVVKKKPLIFLHVFHHSATALLCYTQLNGKTSISWVPITLNLTVHVLLYYYYYASAGGVRIWWKQYLTTMQIIQFVIDLFAVYFGTYSYYAATYFPGKLPVYGTCAGTEGAALFGCMLLTSYLLLFINFYIQTYKKPTSTKEGKKANKSYVTVAAIPNGNGVAHPQHHQNGYAIKN